MPLSVALGEANIRRLLDLTLRHSNDNEHWLRFAALCLFLDISEAEIRAVNRELVAKRYSVPPKPSQNIPTIRRSLSFSDLKEPKEMASTTTEPNEAEEDISDQIESTEKIENNSKSDTEPSSSSAFNEGSL